jgi:hypothetical protein
MTANFVRNATKTTANKMDIRKKYVIYELNNVMGNDNYKALSEVEFTGDCWRSNSFNTEEDAIQALIDENLTYVDYVILRQIYIN